MLDTFDASTFAGRLGEAFRVAAGTLSIETRLIDVARPPGSASGDGALPGVRRAPFSLVFRAPAGAAVLPQRTYRVEHDALGAFDLFLVPIGPDAEGMRYEAVFG